MGVKEYLPIPWAQKGEPGFCVKPNVEYLKKVTKGDLDSFFMLFFDNFSSPVSYTHLTLPTTPYV